MRLLRWLATALAFLALLAIVAATLVMSADYAAVKSELLTLASQRLGRPLAVDGAFHIRLGRTLQLTAEGVRLGNAPWGSRPDMLTASQVLLEVDAWSLLDHPVIVHRIAIDDFDLVLERTAEGANNWDFAAAPEEDQAPWVESLPVVIEEMALPGAQLRFIGPRLDRPLSVRFDTLAQRRDASGLLILAGAGQANDVAIALDARLGPFDALVTGRNFTVSVDSRVGELHLTGQARLDDLAAPVDTEVQVELQAPEADYLATRLGVRNLGQGPVRLSAAIRPDGGGGGVLGTLSGTVGAFVVDANGELADPAVMEKIAVQFAVTGPDLSLLGGLAGMDRLPAEQFRLQGGLRRTGQELTIDQINLELQQSRLQLEGSISRLQDLSGANLRFQFKGSDVARFRQLLNVPGIASGPFAIEGRAQRAANGDELLDLKATTELGEFSISGPVGAYPGYYGSRLRFAAKGNSLARAGTALGIANLPASAFTAKGQFVWSNKGAVLTNSTLTAGNDRLTLNGRIGRQPLGVDTDLRFAMNGRDFRRFAAVLGIAGVPAAAFDLQGRVRRNRKASRLNDLRGTIGGTRLSLEGTVGDEPLQGTIVNFQVNGPALEAFTGLVPGYPLPAGRFSAVGGLELSPRKAAFHKLRLEAAGARARIDADVHLPLSAAAGTFDIDASGPNLARFLPNLGKVRALAKSFALQVKSRVRDGRWSFQQMQVTTGAGRLSLAGDLDWAPDFSATNLRFAADIADLAAAGKLAGFDLPAQPLKLSASFSGTPTAFRMQEMTGQLGPSDFAGNFSLALQAKPRLDLHIRSRLLDLTSLSGGQAAQSPASGPAATPRKRVIPDTPLPLGWLDRADGTIDLTAARVRIVDTAFRSLRLAARLQNGSLFVDPLELHGADDGQLLIQGEIEQGPQGATARFSSTGRQLMISPWTDTSAQAAARPRADLDLQLSAQGRTWRELAAGLAGKVQMVGGAGDTPAAGLDKLLGGLRSSLVRKVSGDNAPPTMHLRCFALVATASGGIVTTAPALAFQTDAVNVISRGTVNLRDETVEFYLRTTPRERLSISAGEIINPYVKIVGPMNAPGLGVDAKGTLFTAGTAFATGGLSIIAQSLWDRVFRASDPCVATLAEADKLALKSASSWPAWLSNPFR